MHNHHHQHHGGRGHRFAKLSVLCLLLVPVIGFIVMWLWNALMPAITAASLAALDLIEESGDLRRRLFANAHRFRDGLERLGFKLVPGEHPIVPVMLGEARLAAEMADRLLAEGIYVIAFSYPVVPQRQARIRTQMSAAHEPDQIDRAIDAFARVGRDLGVIS